ncbi:MAG: biotin-dependent carboxyltransferase family protein [Hydrogenophaga sp.]|uniref:5-oxoprolinase subunit C family protein n=1 Tax=Hydrogenophaga sp. TaxID=1904254 RepID=UPI00274701D6|nr:biotin-dependent carboxyltransferase family protein [Hydrogenophaga sp.]MDP2416937.1 biotin-dependent carboxyltransferase family protein [Hydrogenophaga sp.]MDZ4187643.1 biotin-dependent carboxyltransferase family protein [Hydrogenophaga sp.]
MSGALEIVQPGIGTTVQDRGRAGHRHHGTPPSGWLDAPMAQAANALLGNSLDAAMLELRGMGTVLRVQSGPVRVALAGRTSAICLCSDGRRRTLPAWHSATLPQGDLLQLGAAESGCAYLAVAGGLLVPPQLGSRSSYWRAGLAGVLGRAFRTGDLLPCGQWRGADPREWRSRSPWTTNEAPVRVLLGPQQDHFTADAIAQFLSQDWEATAAQDRMGLRLLGQPLAHVNAAAADIVSDGVAPGAIQVPANGQPIVLLADGQTVGGYPKIATVVSADLPRLAHLLPGTRVRFERVNMETAHRALLIEQDRWQRWLKTREAYLPPGTVDEIALYGANLISGVLHATP